jgi:hypothetical protein
MADEEKVKGQNQDVELDDEVLEDVSGGTDGGGNTNNSGGNNINLPSSGGVGNK